MSFHPFMMRLRERLGLFWREDAGTIAIKFALAVPALALVGAGAMDLTHVQSTKARLDDIADSAALAGASDLGLATDGSNATERARAFVESHLAEWEKAPALEGTYEIVDLQGQRAIRVSLDANRPSFFANLLPPGGWDIHAEATSEKMAMGHFCDLLRSAVAVPVHGLSARVSGWAKDRPLCGHGHGRHAFEPAGFRGVCGSRGELAGRDRRAVRAPDCGRQR